MAAREEGEGRVPKPQHLHVYLLQYHCNMTTGTDQTSGNHNVTTLIEHTLSPAERVHSTPIHKSHKDIPCRVYKVLPFSTKASVETKNLNGKLLYHSFSEIYDTHRCAKMED